MDTSSRALYGITWPVVVGALTLALVGCGSDTGKGGGQAAGDSVGSHSQCGQRVGFELSLASDTGGQPTPIAAATWFAAHGGVEALPIEGWHVVSQNGNGASLSSGSSTVHVAQGSDETWQVDSGTRCN